MTRSDYNVFIPVGRNGQRVIVEAPDSVAAVGHVLQDIWPHSWRILYLRDTVCSVEVHSAMGFATYKVIVVPCK
jgi:hypothetical protein